jgi:cysteinyl-tRNA synthetase
MELKLYDTLTREKRAFTPIDRARVRMYVCGPTVYDFAHIGNARPVIVFDVLCRLLRHIYGAEHVTYVRNITDVDDKINARAAERGVSIRELTEETYNNFKSDVAALGCLPPTVEPRATEHIEEMKALIERLVAGGHAYVAEDNVLFNVPSMADYGQLSKRPLDEMIAGSRVEVAPYKKDPQDFVLWKPSKPGEPAWPSPCGIATPGRPGWHIECSAMSWKHLGETFDIHGGGIDLVFPHHENEIAQSRCAFHTGVMANYWMHNGFLQVEGEKMSKSLGNFITIHELLKEKTFGGRIWSGEVIRFAMLQTHYQAPLDWTVRTLEQSESRLAQWKNFASQRTRRRHNKALRQQILGLLCDDLNTPVAFNLIDQVCKSETSDETDRHTVNWALRRLGFKTRKTIAAKAVDAIDPVISKIADVSDDDWALLLSASRAAPKIQNRQRAGFRNLLAHVAAIGELPELLNNYHVERVESQNINRLPGQFQKEFFISSKLDHLNSLASTQHLRPRINAESWNQLAQRIEALKLVKSLNAAITSLSRLTVNDWNNLAENVRQRPLFSSGRPKPETQLFEYLMLLSQLRNILLHSIGPYEEGFLRKFHRLIFEVVPRVSRVEEKIKKLVELRNAARSRKDFKESDRIRDELAAMGVVLKDSKDGTTWEIAR